MATKKDKIGFEIKPFQDYARPDVRYILRVLRNGVCIEAQRRESVADALTAANDYINYLERGGAIYNKNVRITIKYE